MTNNFYTNNIISNEYVYTSEYGCESYLYLLWILNSVFSKRNKFEHKYGTSMIRFFGC